MPWHSLSGDAIWIRGDAPPSAVDALSLHVPRPIEATAARYGQSPMLRERVDAGQLPPMIEVGEIGSYDAPDAGVTLSENWRPSRR